MKTAVTVCTLIIGIASSVAFSQPTDGSWLGYQPGPYKTGTMLDMWEDGDREDITTSDPDDNRRIMVQIWYPASHDDHPEFVPYSARENLYQEFIRSWLTPVANYPTNSVLNAPLAGEQEQYPLLIYSHGNRFPLFTGTAQTEFLASHGYIVVAIGHPDSSGLASYPDGKPYVYDTQPSMPSREELMKMIAHEFYLTESADLARLFEAHAEDFSFAIDRMEGLSENSESLFYHRVNFDQIGTFGWSRGGATALQVAIDDDRIKAGVLLDGDLFQRPMSRTGTHVPILMLENPSYDLPFGGEMDPNRQESISALDSEKWGMLNRSTDDWYRVRISGAAHLNFSDVPLLVDLNPTVAGTIDPLRAHELIRSLVFEFFGKYLRHDTTAPILGGEQQESELRIARPAQ
ncbi:carboxylic ester hydrolase [Pseudohongiella nitratireducens]|uniref:Carboxylic ester hydrolase n=1 Tax=Pseudohongiella nitratireducens TaxID=1768907 RepID=A0A916QLW8_9GAMM|nr:hypothetical protein [Pseudohongiella nitratireducens]GFZ82936.1 carboxylic ester hydrolase [Pseudohongiella nitratireducens]